MLNISTLSSRHLWVVQLPHVVVSAAVPSHGDSDQYIGAGAVVAALRHRNKASEALRAGELAGREHFRNF